MSYREATGNTALYESAVRAADQMVVALLDSDRRYFPGHPEIEHALMRLYEDTGDKKYLRLSAWLIAQRGNHQGRQSADIVSQDHIPVREQRTIEGHAVCAAFLFNGVTEYVGATGDAACREAVSSIWNDLVQHKLYLHGAAGNISTRNEGYSPQPYHIPPYDCYGESCASFGNFQWAHSMFRLSGEAGAIDVAERILYNAFYAALSLAGDRYFYCNPAGAYVPTLRYEWHSVPCCPPNIVKLIAKVGGFFYATDEHGIFIKHYGASEAQIPFDRGVKLIQQGRYPWDGEITLHVQPKQPMEFALRLRVPGWAQSFSLAVNGKAVEGEARQGWVALRRRWRAGDRVELRLPMTVERVTMPPEFKDYKDLVALRRGPLVYCIEEQDVSAPLEWLHLPPEAAFVAEHRPDLLGGVTVLRGMLSQSSQWYIAPATVPATFVPYGVWNNRTPGRMRIWLSTQPGSTLQEMFS